MELMKITSAMPMFTMLCSETISIRTHDVTISGMTSYTSHRYPSAVLGGKIIF